jgi:hypothetical protein
MPQDIFKGQIEQSTSVPPWGYISVADDVEVQNF